MASFMVNSQFYIKAICNIPNNNNEVVITLDDGPEKIITPKILEILNKYNITATFFCIGEKAESNPELLLQIKNAGHLIGNHTFTHSKWFDFFSSKKMIEEFDKTNNSIYKITGNMPVYFRPPYGVSNPTIKSALKKFNFVTIGWSLRSLDTVIKSKEKVLNRLLKRVKSGDIILFHDIVPNSPEIMDEFIATIIRKGFKIVSLDHLLNQKHI